MERKKTQDIITHNRGKRDKEAGYLLLVSMFDPVEAALCCIAGGFFAAMLLRHFSSDEDDINKTEMASDEALTSDLYFNVNTGIMLANGVRTSENISCTGLLPHSLENSLTDEQSSPNSLLQRCSSIQNRSLRMTRERREKMAKRRKIRKSLRDNVKAGEDITSYHDISTDSGNTSDTDVTCSSRSMEVADDIESAMRTLFRANSLQQRSWTIRKKRKERMRRRKDNSLQEYGMLIDPLRLSI